MVGSTCQCHARIFWTTSVYNNITLRSRLNVIPIVSDMIVLLQRLRSFLKYWYFRYMLVTELYMVEKWERNFINIFLIATFFSFFLFNWKIVLPVVQYTLRSSSNSLSEIKAS